VDIGIMNIGTIQGKMKIYKDPLFPNCKILMGFKGNSVLDAGYFYAPYIPLLSTPTVLDPNSYTPNKGIMTRYGKKLIEDGGLLLRLNIAQLKRKLQPSRTQTRGETRYRVCGGETIGTSSRRQTVDTKYPDDRVYNPVC
jgi:hypothetical protein